MNRRDALITLATNLAYIAIAAAVVVSVMLAGGS